MRSAAWVAATLLLAFALPAPGEDAAAGPPEAVELRGEDGSFGVTLRLSPSAPRIGEVVRLEMTAVVAGGAPVAANDDRVVRWPDLTAVLSEALGDDVVEVEEVRRSADGFSLAARLRLYDAGRFEIPALAAELRRAGRTDEDPLARVSLEGAAIEIASLLPDEAEPLAGRGELTWEPERETPTWPWFAGAGVVALVLLAAWLLRRRGTAAPLPPPPVYVPPHERALRSLRALLERHLPQQGDVEPYFVELSEILRRYLEERFGLRAPEQTTEEFLAQVSGTEAGRRAIDAAHRDVLREFLTRADLVKFARATPDLSQCEGAAGAARRFVEDTAAPQVEPSEAPA